MSVELRTLRASAEMDAANFVAGAKAVETSSAQAGKAVGGLGAAVQQTDTKVSQSGNILARLERQYVDGAGAAQRMQAAVNSLSRGIDDGKISMAQAAPILEGIYRKYGQLSSGAQVAARGQAELAAAIDRTTAKMQLQAQAQARMPIANDNDVTGGDPRFRRQNLGYQLFDVAQMQALGQNPAMTLMQQGPQIAQLYAMQGGIKALGADLVGIARSTGVVGAGIAAAMAIGAAAVFDLQSAIKDTTGESMSFGDVATGAIAIIASDIYSFLKPAVDAIAPWFTAAWDAAAAGGKTAINLFIAGWSIQFDALKTAIGTVPDAFVYAGEAAANGFLTAIEEMAQEIVAVFNGMIARINGALRSAGIGTQIGDLGNPNALEVGRIDIGGEAARGRIGESWGGFHDRSRSAFGTDYVGDYRDSLARRIAERGSSGGLPDTMEAPKFRGIDDQPGATQAFGYPVGFGTPEWQTNLRGDIKGFFSDLRAGIMQGEDIGKALANAILNAFNKAADHMIDQLANTILDAVFGTGFQDGRGGGLMGIIGSAATGGGSIAANDNGATGGYSNSFSDLAAVGASTFTGAGVTKTGIGLSTVSTQGLTAKVASEYAGRFQGLFDDLEAAGYKISSLGEGGYSYRKVAGSKNWSKHAFGEAVDINPRANPHSYSGRMDFDEYGIDPDALARKNGLTWGGNWRKPDTMHFQVDKTVESLSRLDATTTSATKALGGFGGGLAQLGQALSGIGGGAGGSGWFSGLISQFGSVGGATSWMNSISPAATSFIAGGGVGLFHSGGIAGQASMMRYGVDPRVFLGAPRYHGGGIAGDEVPAILKRGEPVFKSMQHAREVVGGSSSTFAPVFNVDARGSTMTRGEFEDIARAQSQQALAAYDRQMQKGGIGAMNSSYQKLKAS